jgi:hypothetical protein
MPVSISASRRYGKCRRLATCRELDCRDSQSLRVRLLWCSARDQVLVHVHGPDGTDFWLNPPKALARYAFEHPFALVRVYPMSPEPQAAPFAA